MRLIDADVLKQHIDKLPALPDGNFAGNHSALKALINMQPTIEPSTNCSEFPNNLDTISRAKAIEALDKRFDSIPMEQTSEILMLRKDLRNLPPAQSEHIIHCKDCKYFKQVFARNDMDGLCGHWHSKWDARTSPKGYCSYAERKQNDTERC